jgi:hypothetical protein
MTMLDELKEQLNITDNSKDVYLQFIIDVLVQKAINYCNLTVLPKALEKVLLSYAKDLWYIGTSDPSNQGSTDVSSIKRGDTQINYASFSNTIRKMTSSDIYMSDYYKQLHVFRRIRW